MATGVVDGRVAWACLASLLLYSGGMILNDAADALEDAEHRPDRPIPSGRVARPTAYRAGFAALAAAQCAVIPCGAGARILAALMAGLILLYDLLPTLRRGTGPLCLAAIRGCNVVLGALAGIDASGLQGRYTGAIALGYAVYVMAPYVLLLSLVAAGETGPPRAWHPAAVLGAMAPVFPLLILALTNRERGPGHMAAAVACVVLLTVVGRAVRSVGKRPQAAVGSLLGGICLLDAAAAGIMGGPMWAAAGGAAWVIAWAVGRRHSPT